jgi:hypothetical protein
MPSSDCYQERGGAREECLAGSTCECVSTAFRQAPVLVFQNRIMRSAVPPPDASRCRCHGHHESALTAA